MKQTTRWRSHQLQCWCWADNIMLNSRILSMPFSLSLSVRCCWWSRSRASLIGLSAKHDGQWTVSQSARTRLGRCMLETVHDYHLCAFKLYHHMKKRNAVSRHVSFNRTAMVVRKRITPLFFFWSALLSSRSVYTILYVKRSRHREALPSRKQCSYEERKKKKKKKTGNTNDECWNMFKRAAAWRWRGSRRGKLYGEIGSSSVLVLGRWRDGGTTWDYIILIFTYGYEIVAECVMK